MSGETKEKHMLNMKLWLNVERRVSNQDCEVRIEQPRCRF